MSEVVRISKDHKDLLEDVADQLDTSLKSVVDMIIQWFFETDWGNPDVIARLMADDEEDDEDEDEDWEDDEDDEE